MIEPHFPAAQSTRRPRAWPIREIRPMLKVPIIYFTTDTQNNGASGGRATSKPSKRAGAPVQIEITDAMIFAAMRALQGLQGLGTASELVARGVFRAMIDTLRREEQLGVPVMVCRERVDRFEP
jgi:hypothetical protein